MKIFILKYKDGKIVVVDEELYSLTINPNLDKYKLDVTPLQYEIVKNGFTPKWVNGEFDFSMSNEDLILIKGNLIEKVKEDITEFNAVFLSRYSQYEREGFPYKIEVGEEILANLADISAVNPDHLEFADTEIAMRDEKETREQWAVKVIGKAKALKIMSAKGSGLRAKAQRLITESTSVEKLMENLIALKIEANTVRTEYGIPVRE